MKSPNDPTDTPLPLSAPIRQVKPAAAPVPIGNGCVKRADGTFATSIPEPAPIWTAPIYTPPVAIEDGQAEDWEGLGCRSSLSEVERKAADEAAEFLRNLPEYGGLL